MSIENERKYTVSEVPDPFRATLDITRPIHITQHYLVVKPDIEIRIRKKDAANVEAFGYSLDIKSGGYQQERPEESITIDQEQFDRLKELAIGGVRKKRYEVGDLELDIFKDIDLMLLEIENPHVDPPDWVDEEVTGEEKYYNSYIAINPSEESW